MAKEMINIDGVNVCPKCHERKFEELHTAHGYTSIVSYDIAPKNKQDKGKFEFTYKCANCGIRIKEYINM